MKKHFTNKLAQLYFEQKARKSDIIEAGIDSKGLVYFAWANGKIDRQTRASFLKEAKSNVESIIQAIIFPILGNGVVERRIAALETAGFSVNGPTTEYGFGTSGTVRTIGGNTKAQLGCAFSVSCKNGYRVNRCEVYTITIK